MDHENSPTTSDEEFIVTDSQMEEESDYEDIEDRLELLFESFVNLQEKQKLLEKEIQRQGNLFEKLQT